MPTGSEINFRKAALFDLDFTLISINSTYAFIDFYLVHYQKYSRPYFILKWTMLCSSVGFPVYLGKKRDHYFRFLKGVPKEKLRSAAREFVCEVTNKHLNQSLFSHYQTLSKEGYYCCLVSSSFDFVVSAFAEAWKFDDFFASVSRFDQHDRCLGVFEKDLTGIKESVVNEIEKRAGPWDRNGSYFFTDNQEDLPLAQQIGNSFGVVRNGIQYSFWKKHAIDTLRFIPRLPFSPYWFILPLFYYFHFRTSAFSFLFYQVGAPLFALFCMTDTSLKSGLLLFAAIGGYLALYEIGYFFNDIHAVKNETNPSLRFTESEGRAVQVPFIISRVGFFCATTWILSRFNPSGQWRLYVVMNILTVILFLQHNRLRQDHRYLTYALLKCSHFVVPLAVFSLTGLSLFLPLLIVYLPIPLLFYIEKLKEIPRTICLRWYWAINILFLLSLVIAAKGAFPEARGSLLLSCYLLFGHLAGRKLGVYQMLRPLLSRVI